MYRYVLVLVNAFKVTGNRYLLKHACPKLEQKSANRSLVSLFQSLLYTYHSLMFSFNQGQNP